MKPLRYLDFELKIDRARVREGHYTASVSSPQGETSSIFTLPFSEDKLENLVLKLGRLRSITRHIYSEEMEAAREFGGKLFESVFSGEVLACFRSSLNEARTHEDTGLRLKLRLQEVPELADIPWEFIYDSSSDRFLAQSNQTPIVRYIELHQRIQPLTISLPLNVLVMISSPSDYTRLDVERERSMLLKALDPLIKERKVRVDWLENATLQALQHRLQKDEYHVFHFIGHGGFNKKTEEGVLVMEDEEERGWLAEVHRIGTLLHDHRPLRLAVLNSCEGARNSRTDPFAGVASSLIQQGVPAVVAMQFEITDDAAITFAGQFYTALAEGFPVDSAVAEARKAIYALPNDIEWGTPVLYMRSPDGVLFNLIQKPAVEKIPPLVPKPATIPSKLKTALKTIRMMARAQARILIAILVVSLFTYNLYSGLIYDEIGIPGIYVFKWGVRPPHQEPMYWAYVERISVFTKEFVSTLPNGTKIIISNTRLVPKFINRTVSPDGNTHEYYALMRDSDPEAMMDLITGPSLPDIVACDLSRLCLAAVDIYLDGELICSFPEGHWIGYINFDIPK